MGILQPFLSSGSKPVCIGFGSMLDDKAERLVAIIKAYIAHTRRRVIVVGGWQALHSKQDGGGNLYCIDEVPHDWLLPQVAAMVHHGGAGTTAAVLRAGVPSVVVPFFADQPFWGDRLCRLRLSPRPIPRRTLTTKRLARAIRSATGDAAIRRRNSEAGKMIRAEDGVSSAVKIIASRLGSSEKRAFGLTFQPGS